MDKETIGSLAQGLKSQRLSKGYTQQELADKAGVSLRSIQRIENGEVYPRSFTLKTLAETLELDFEQLVLKTKSPSTQRKGLNKSQKIVLSVLVAIILFLLVCAFIFQSPAFPETAFEFTVLLAIAFTIYGFALVKIWR